MAGVAPLAVLVIVVPQAAMAVTPEAVVAGVLTEEAEIEPLDWVVQP
jgi:hypothetical protein